MDPRVNANFSPAKRHRSAAHQDAAPSSRSSSSQSAVPLRTRVLFQSQDLLRGLQALDLKEESLSSPKIGDVGFTESMIQSAQSQRSQTHQLKIAIDSRRAELIRIIARASQQNEVAGVSDHDDMKEAMKVVRQREKQCLEELEAVQRVLTEMDSLLDQKDLVLDGLQTKTDGLHRVRLQSRKKYDVDPVAPRAPLGSSVRSQGYSQNDQLQPVTHRGVYTEASAQGIYQEDHAQQLALQVPQMAVQENDPQPWIPLPDSHPMDQSLQLVYVPLAKLFQFGEVCDDHRRLCHQLIEKNHMEVQKSTPLLGLNIARAVVPVNQLRPYIVPEGIPMGPKPIMIEYEEDYVPRTPYDAI